MILVESARRMLQVARAAVLLSIVIYGFLVKQIPSNAQANPVVYRSLVLLAILDLGVIVVFRRKLVKPAEQALAAASNDGVALGRWRTGYLLTYALSEAIALYGVVLHFLGFKATQVAPFLIAGLTLMLFYSPRVPVPYR